MKKLFELLAKYPVSVNAVFPYAGYLALKNK